MSLSKALKAVHHTLMSPHDHLKTVCLHESQPLVRVCRDWLSIKHPLPAASAQGSKPASAAARGLQAKSSLDISQVGWQPLGSSLQLEVEMNLF